MPIAALSRAFPAGTFLRPALATALLALLIQSTIAPTLGWSLAAWTPTHIHITLNGGPVPPHTHPWERSGNNSAAACTAEPPAGATAPATTVVCSSDGGSADSITGPVIVDHQVVSVPVPTAIIAAAIPASPDWTSYIAPIPVPPPIA